jgi:putative oxidoreductase
MERLFMPFVTGPGAVALLIMRLAIGSAFMLHGWPKIQNPFGWMPPGAPIPGFLQALAAVSEFGGGLAWILGLLTPIASFGILCTMAVAAYTHISRGDPFVASRPGTPSFELALAYFSVALVMMLAGPGRLSLDALLFGKRWHGGHPNGWGTSDARIGAASYEQRIP